MKLQTLCLVGLASITALGCGASAGDMALAGGGGSSKAAPTGDDGLLTAGDWDDNMNFGAWQSYRSGDAAKGLVPVDYETQDRITILVTNEDGKPVSNARVSVVDGMTAFEGPTGSDGRALFFPSHDNHPLISPLVKVEAPADQPGVAAVSGLAPQGSDWHVVLPGAQPKAPAALDLAFVVDTTGSMGDELSYLQKEIDNIVSDVHGQFKDVDMRLALIVYKDHGDDYTVKSVDFSPSLTTFQVAINGESAGGGGDEPEAMDEAIEAIPKLTWRAGNVARMAVLVTDAPPHEDREQAAVDGFDLLRPQGIRLYPLAASGVEDNAEFVLRLGAEVTGGRYMFLTDDSGVGAPHKAPSIPCYEVRKLKDVLVYEIASELSGQRAPIPEAQVIRDFGDPTNGVCKLQDGTEAHLW